MLRMIEILLYDVHGQLLRQDEVYMLFGDFVTVPCNEKTGMSSEIQQCWI